jgi:hypothetical protein
MKTNGASGGLRSRDPRLTRPLLHQAEPPRPMHIADTTTKIKTLTTLKHSLKTLIIQDAILISAKAASEIFWLRYIKP